MKKFKWEAKRNYGNGKKIYISDRILINKTNKKYSQSEISVGINGRCTAYACILFSVEWPTNKNSHWGYELTKHFSGKQAANKARGWCNYLLNNPPDYHNKYTIHYDYNDIFRGLR